jgi:hypothetical protein
VTGLAPVDDHPARPEPDLATASVAWTEQWLDRDVGLVWNPVGSYDEEAPPRSVHLLPQSAWLALGLLARDRPGDRATAGAVIEALLAGQYDEPGTIWHGTFRRFWETPHPAPGAVEWVDYDPNWRHFIGTTFALALRRFADRVGDALADRMAAAIRLAVEGEPPDRVQPSYSNIALMRAWLEVEAGTRENRAEWVAQGERLGEAVAERFARFGAFDEYNSPTYYGIDLYALGLWCREPVSASLAEQGEVMERALWEDTAALYHAGLRNQCGPFSRSYGTDMRRYAATIGLWVWEALGAELAPYPSLAASFDHSHDTTIGPAVALLGADVPAAAEPHLRAFQGERMVEREISDRPPRVATAWLAEGCSIGAERNQLGVYATGQFMPATIHWREGTLRVEHHGSTSAVAAPGRLTVSTQPHHREGPRPLQLVVEAPGADPAACAGGRLRLPGAELVLTGPGADDATASERDDQRLAVRLPPPSGPATYELEVVELR